MMHTLSVLFALFGALQVALGVVNPGNYRVLGDEEGIGNGAYDFYAFCP